jgi:hypothetical protein
VIYFVNLLFYGVRAEVEQISPDIIERSVQSVDECEMAGGRAISKFALNFTVNLRCLFIFEVN